MIQAYVDYWKKSFNYTANFSIKEFLIAFILNFFILTIIFFIGIFVPVIWENILVDVWYIVMLFMSIPTISLFIRLIRGVIKS
ncbi:hypothetical protein ACTPIR_002099 [Enterococcus hirae]